MTIALAAPRVAVPEYEWRERAERHRARVEPWVQRRLQWRREGRAHPVDDFLFDYYAWRPGQLLRWHPGWGSTLMGAVDEWHGHRGYRVDGDTAAVDPAVVGRLRPVLASVRRLLAATASRPPALGCFGRHEWAMVYRAPAASIRHERWPLRLTPAEIDEVVETQPLRCTHIDAYRFFTDAARPRNLVHPTRASQEDHEQPGCLHATMDLYKWSFRLYPIVGAEATADAFEAARAARDVDMRASPYDLSDLGYQPLRIETPEGRQEYVEHQRGIAERARPLRSRLIALIDGALGADDRRESD